MYIGLVPEETKKEITELARKCLTVMLFAAFLTIYVALTLLVDCVKWIKKLFNNPQDFFKDVF